jgi:alanine-synthesizing transaminase
VFSHRLAWPYPSNRLALLLRRKREAGVTLLDLTESNPTRVGIDYPVQAIAAALAEQAGAPYDPDARGLAAARRAVADHLGRRSMAVDPERIVLTASSSEAYAFLFKLLADPGREVLVPRPSYPLFDYLAALEGVRCAPYPIVHEPDWRIDLEALERVALGDGTERPAACVVVNPNNPTGSGLVAEDWRRLGTVTTRHALPLISDEVFLDFVEPPDPGMAAVVSLATAAAADAVGPVPTFTLGGLSKGSGLPQMKLGWIVVGGPERQAREAMERLELIADTFLSVGGPVQRAAGRLLALGETVGAALRERVRRNRAVLRRAVERVPACRLLPADGGWSAVLQVPAVRPEEDLVLGLLEEADVLIHPGYFFDFPREAFLVASLLPPPDRFDEAIGRVLARAAGG